MSPAPKRFAASLVGMDELTATPATNQTARPTPLTGVSRSAPQDGDRLVVNLPVDSILPNPYQPRDPINPAELHDLAQSIAAHDGVFQPILVRPAKNAEPNAVARFELVAGERRWRASQLAKLPTVQAIVRDVDDATSAEMALSENMARHDLSPMEKARGCAVLRDTFGMTVTDIARRVGRDRTAISHLIRLLDLPDKAKDLIARGDLSEGHGRVLLTLEDYSEQLAVAILCAHESWSVRELERQVDARRAPAAPKATVVADQTAALAAFAERMRPVFGTSPVKIVARRHGAYEIQVRVEDLDELAATVARLAGPEEPA